jgi:hypothetical protein
MRESFSQLERMAVRAWTGGMWPEREPTCSLATWTPSSQATVPRVRKLEHRRYLGEGFRRRVDGHGRRRRGGGSVEGYAQSLLEIEGRAKQWRAGRRPGSR